MKNIFKIALAGAFMLSAPVAQADDDVTLQLKWVTQAQFAGYYVALDKGFYKDEGLNVTIKPGIGIAIAHLDLLSRPYRMTHRIIGLMLSSRFKLSLIPVQ